MAQSAPLTLARRYSELAGVLAEQHRYAACEQAGARALKIYASNTHGKPAKKGELHFRIAKCKRAGGIGDIDAQKEAQGHLEKAVGLFRQAKSKTAYVRAQITLGRVLKHLDEHQAAFDVFADAITHAKANQLVDDSIIALVYQSEACSMLGQRESAEKYAETAHQLLKAQPSGKRAHERAVPDD